MESELIYLMAHQNKTPCARIHGTSPSITTAGNVLQLSTTDYAKNGMTTGANSITVPVAGVYAINAGVRFTSAASTGVYEINVQASGTGVPNAVQFMYWSGSTAASPWFNDYSDLINLSAGSVLTLYGNNINLTLSYAYLSVALVSL